MRQVTDFASKHAVCEQITTLFIAWIISPRTPEQGKTWPKCSPRCPPSSILTTFRCPPEARTSLAQPGTYWTSGELSKAHVPAPLASSPSSVRRSDIVTPLEKRVDVVPLDEIVVVSGAPPGHQDTLTHGEQGVVCIPLVCRKTRCFYCENWLRNQISLTGDHLNTSGRRWYVRVLHRPDNIRYRLRRPYCIHKLPPNCHVVATRSGVPCLHCGFWPPFFPFVVGMWAR